MARKSLTDAPERGWGAGWPVDRRADMVRAEGGGVRFQIHREIEPIVSRCLRRTVELGYRLDPTQCGGYTCRPMKRTDGSLTNTPSNHSWGLAVDLNWRQNGFGRHARHDIPEEVAEIWIASGFNWGGQWTAASPDWMHFEFAHTPARARELWGDTAGEPARPPRPDEEENEEMVGFTAAVVPPGAHPQTNGVWAGRWPFVAVRQKEDGTSEFVGMCGCLIKGGVNGFGVSVLNLGRLNAPILALSCPEPDKVVGLAPGDGGTFMIDIEIVYL